MEGRREKRGKTRREGENRFSYGRETGTEEEEEEEVVTEGEMINNNKRREGEVRYKDSGYRRGFIKRKERQRRP